MMRHFALILIGTLIPFISIAQPERIINQWNPHGEVKDLFLNPDGSSIYMVGDFDYWTNYRPYASVLDHETLLPVPGQDFNRGVVNDVVADGMGGWYVGGRFDVAPSDDIVENGLFHLDAELNVIAGFPVANEAVHDLKLMGDTLFVAGEFSSVGGKARRGLAAISVTTQQVLDLDVQINGSVRTIDVWNDTLYLGGSFNAVNNFGNYGAQLNKFTGDVDAYFDSPDNHIYTSVADGNGGWFIGGYFFHVGDSVRFDLAHLGADGRVSGWKCNLGDQPYSLSYVQVLEIHDNYLYVGGRFEKIGGVTRNNAARVDLLTGEVEAWDPNIYGYPECFAFHDQSIFVGGTYDLNLTGQWVANGGVVDATTALVAPSAQSASYMVDYSVPDDDGGFFIAGGFTTIGDSIRNGFAQMDANGEVTGFVRHFEVPEYSLVRDMAYHDGILYYTSSYSDDYPGEPIEAVDMEGNKVPIDLSAMPEMTITLLKTFGDTLFIGGTFQDVTGVYTHSVRAVSIPDFELLPISPNLQIGATDVERIADTLYIAGDFTAVNQFPFGTVIDTTTLESTNPGTLTNGAVNVAIGDGLGGFFISGAYDEIQDAACNGVAYINPDGNPECVGIETNGQVYTMLVRGDTLFLGGDFTEVNGTTRSGFAVWSISNGMLLGWNPSFDSEIRDFALYGETLFVAGSFDHVDGQTRNRLAAFNLSTSSLTSFAPVFSNDVRTLHVHQNELLVAGSFLTINSVSRVFIGSFNLLTMTLTNWHPVTNTSIYDITSAGDQIFVCGLFDTIGGLTRHKFAAFTNGSSVPNSLTLPFNQYWEMVTTLDTDGEKLLLGGKFSASNNSNFMVIDLTTNQTLNLPGANDQVRCIAHSGNKFFVGGDFTKIAGTATSGLVGLDMTTNTFTGFNPDYNGNINQLESNGNFLYAGGNPHPVDGIQVGKLAIFDVSTGEVVNTNPYFTTSEFNYAEISALYKHNDRMYIGLSSVSSFDPFKNFAFCLNTADNSLLDFDPQAIGDIHTISATDDAVYIGGYMIHMGGTKLDGFAAYDMTTGDFLPDQLVLGQGNIFRMTVYNDLLIAGGSNISAGGGSQKSLVAYNFQTQQEKYFNGQLDMTGVITAMDEYDGKLYYGGNGFYTASQHLYGYNLNTDAAMNITFPFSPSQGFVYDLAVDASGLYVVHAFDGSSSANQYVSAFNPSTGVRIADWQIDISGESTPEVKNISLQGDELYLGGKAKLIGNNRRTNLASVSLANGLETAWKPNVNNTVNRIIALDKGLFVGGAFTKVNNNTGNGFLTSFNTATGEVRPYQYLYWVKNEVYDLEYNPGSQDLYVSGAFSTDDNSAANYLLAMSTVTNQLNPNWQSGPLQHPANISYYNDTLWAEESVPYGLGESCFVRKLLPSGAFSDDSIPVFGLVVNAMAFQDDRIFAGGNFDGVGGIPRHNILEIDAATGELTDFNPAISMDPILKVLRAGDHVILMGNSDDQTEIRAINVDTYEELPEFSENLPYTLSADGVLELYNGEYFYNIDNGVIVRRNALTGASLPFPELETYGEYLEASSGFLYAVLNQYTPDGNVSTFSRTDIENGENMPFDPTIDGNVQSMAERDGKIYIAGDFSEVNGIQHLGIARFDGATGALDNWTTGDIVSPYNFRIFSTETSLYESVLADDGEYHNFRRINPNNGNLSEWSMHIEATDVVEVGNRLYAAGPAFPTFFYWGETFTAFHRPVVGCMDPEGSNYNPLATEPATCFFEAGAAATTIWAGDGNDIFGRIAGAGHSAYTLEQWGITLYPNPGSPGKPIRIAFKDIAEKAAFQIEVRDLTGRIIQTQELAVPKGNMETELSLKETLSEGIYVVSFVNQNTQITKKLVISK